MTLSAIVKDDVKKQLKGVFSTGEKSKQLRVHELPDLNYIMATRVGKFDSRKPNGTHNIFKCLNRVKHYTVRELNRNFIIGPNEVECEDRTGEEAFITVMICVPDYLDEPLIHRAMMDSLGRIDESIFLRTIPGGKFAQILHEGSYEDIEATRAEFDRQIMANGYVPVGTSTEINMTPMFFNDRCKIIIRQRIQ